MSTVIMSGNEAVARGAWEAGVVVATGYPGTPSSEILEELATYGGNVYCQWACNEKVAVEIASGASIGGARSLATMKHVGLNVAADPLCTMAYIGVNGGLVIVSADDPGCHSSQNEQDNRLYAPLAKVALVEASDSQECKDYIRLAFEISERFDIPVLFRMTTRVCHSKSLVRLKDRKEVGIRPYQRNIEKNAMLPASARKRHLDRETSLCLLEAYADDCPLNRVEWTGDRGTGVITKGICYQHAREVFGDTVSYLKLGLTYPMPTKLIRDFAQSVGEIYVIEEGDPVFENKVRQLGFTCKGKDVLPLTGELNAQIVRQALRGIGAGDLYTVAIQPPPRPPILCAGCPHRGFFYALSRHRKRLIAVGDIGCYSLAVQPPLEGFDISICMGSGLSAPIGLAQALKRQGDRRKVFGIVGDSTFFHSGLTSLIDVIHSGADVCACILDNCVTAMTGHQGNPGTTLNVMGQLAPAIDLTRLVRATGIGDDRLRIVDPLDFKEMHKAVDDATSIEGPFIIITKRPCAMIKEVARANAGRQCVIHHEKCRSCGACMRIGCPAMALRDGKPYIADPASCNGCGLCKHMCRFDAIEKVGE